jgi:hypothetical protein
MYREGDKAEFFVQPEFFEPEKVFPEFVRKVPGHETLVLVVEDVRPVFAFLESGALSSVTF